MTFTAVAPNATFQSTSTMLGSGSAYASNPTLNAEGIATYTGQPSSPDYIPGGPRKIFTPGNGGTQQPLGDELIPLLIIAAIYTLMKLVRRNFSYPNRRI